MDSASARSLLAAAQAVAAQLRVLEDGPAAHSRRAVLLLEHADLVRLWPAAGRVAAARPDKGEHARRRSSCARLSPRWRTPAHVAYGSRHVRERDCATRAQPRGQSQRLYDDTTMPLTCTYTRSSGAAPRVAARRACGARGGAGARRVAAVLAGQPGRRRDARGAVRCASAVPPSRVRTGVLPPRADFYVCACAVISGRHRRVRHALHGAAQRRCARGVCLLRPAACDC
jgi:hypothetical protein